MIGIFGLKIIYDSDISKLQDWTTELALQVPRGKQKVLTFSIVSAILLRVLVLPLSSFQFLPSPLIRVLCFTILLLLIVCLTGILDLKERAGELITARRAGTFHPRIPYIIC